MVILRCPHCKHIWEYTGTRGYNVCCPNCNYKVFLTRKNIIESLDDYKREILQPYIMEQKLRKEITEELTQKHNLEKQAEQDAVQFEAMLKQQDEEHQQEKAEKEKLKSTTNISSGSTAAPKP